MKKEKLNFHYKIAIGIIIISVFGYFLVFTYNFFKGLSEESEFDENIFPVHEDTYITEEAPSVCWSWEDRLWISSNLNKRMYSNLKISNIDKIPIVNFANLMIYVPEDCYSPSPFLWFYSEKDDWIEGVEFCSGSDTCIGTDVLFWGVKPGLDYEMGRMESLGMSGWYALDITEKFKEEQQNF